MCELCFPRAREKWYVCEKCRRVLPGSPAIIATVRCGPCVPGPSVDTLAGLAGLREGSGGRPGEAAERGTSPSLVVGLLGEVRNLSLRRWTLLTAIFASAVQ